MEILHSFLQRGNHWNTKALALRHMGWECPARLLDHQGCRNPHTNLSGMLEPEQVVAVPASPKVQILWSFWASITSWVYSWEQDEVVSLLSYGEIGYLETVRVSVCLFDSRQPSSIFFFFNLFSFHPSYVLGMDRHLRFSIHSLQCCLWIHQVLQ